MKSLYRVNNRNKDQFHYDKYTHEEVTLLTE